MGSQTKTYPVVYQEWDESERGWGIRPDGCSLHLNEEDARLFVKQYWDSMPKEVPDEYSRPGGNPKVIQVNEAIYKQLTSKKAVKNHGVRFFQWETRELKLPTV